jgi:glycosyltransferase involved in cell wall biosynthesis
VTTCIPALALRAVTGTPVAVWVQDLWPETVAAVGIVRPRWLVGTIGQLSRRIYRNCDMLLGQSRAFLPRLEQAGIPPERLDYLPNWAEELYRAPVPPRAEVTDWARGFPILFAGNIGRVQGLETILQAARLTQDIPDLRWVFAGTGSLQGWLAEQAASAGLADRMFFLGQRPIDEMPDLFARAAAMLVSLKPNDVMSLTIPSKLQSYLAAGRPVLGSIDGEAARVITESGAGWAAPAGDARGLAAIVRRLRALHPAARDHMGRAGRAYYDREFDRSVCLDRLERHLGKLAEKVRT